MDDPAGPGSTAPEQTPPSTEAATGTPVPLDANATRGMHFRRMLKSWRAAVFGGGLIAASFGVVTGTVGPAAGAAAGGGAVILVLLITFWMADSAAAEDFFTAFSAARGLTYVEKDDLPAVTDLLRRGDRNYSEHIMGGRLPGGLEGQIAHYTYEQDYYDKDGKKTNYYHFTVVLGQIPECVARVPKLVCHRRSGLKILDKAEDAFRSNKRLELESEALDSRYEIFVGPDQDENWIKQLFSPSFIVYLTETPPKKYGFEVESGALCAFVSGRKEKSVELDALCTVTSEIARRIREESLE